jgi:GrpB-like predicted nucleotidyltransferase (UPF0157 family)
MRGDEDDAAALVARGLQVLERDRIDLHEVAQLGTTHRGEPHDLGEVLAEVPERSARDTRDLRVFRGSPEYDREVALRDVASAAPDEVRELTSNDGSRVDKPRGEALHQRRRDAPRPVQRIEGEAQPN